MAQDRGARQRSAAANQNNGPRRRPAASRGRQQRRWGGPNKGGVRIIFGDAAAHPVTDIGFRDEEEALKYLKWRKSSGRKHGWLKESEGRSTGATNTSTTDETTTRRPSHDDHHTTTIAHDDRPAASAQPAVAPSDPLSLALAAAAAAAAAAAKVCMAVYRRKKKSMKRRRWRQKRARKRLLKRLADAAADVVCAVAAGGAGGTHAGSAAAVSSTTNTIALEKGEAQAAVHTAASVTITSTTSEMGGARTTRPTDSNMEKGNVQSAAERSATAAAATSTSTTTQTDMAWTHRMDELVMMNRSISRRCGALKVQSAEDWARAQAAEESVEVLRQQLLMAVGRKDKHQETTARLSDDQLQWFRSAGSAGGLDSTP